MTCVAVFHNILWSRYKGAIFSRLASLAALRMIEVDFVQIAETEEGRSELSAVDLSYHRYDYRLLFRGDYDAIPKRKLVAALLAALRRRPYGLVILPGYHRQEYWAMLAYCILSRTPAAVFCDSTAFDRPSLWYRQLAKRLFFSMCDGFFAYGVRSREYLVGLGAAPERVIDECQAAALPHDYDPQEALANRVKNVFSRSSPAFLYVGRLSPEKGVRLLLAAFSRFLRARPHARLTIVGVGPLLPELRSLARELAIEDAVVFTGAQVGAALATHYSRSTALILPSTSEPWGLVANEALSYGCPVVASDVCGCVPELVLDGVTGYAFPSGDAAALENCLRDVTELVAQSPWQTSSAAIKQAHQYTPARAAANILEGSLRILRRQGGACHA